MKIASKLYRACFFSLISCFFLIILLTACQPQKVRMPIMPKTAVPGEMKRSDPLTCPTIPPSPNQADEGAYVYCQVCMTCHGDVGQGLTAWREQLDPPDNNCFQSGCHGKRHPPEGFEIPTEAPVIIGPNVLSAYQNAQELHDYLVKTMPWWKPGYLKPDEYWQLTAWMLRANGYDLGSYDLNETNAKEVLLNR